MILDGKKESIKIREEIKKEIFSIKSNKKKVPGLSVILIGDFALLGCNIKELRLMKSLI